MKLFTLTVCTLLLSFAHAGKVKLCIVKDHHPKATIVISPQAPHLVKFAAKELQKYIYKMSKAQLSIKHIPAKNEVNIFVGPFNNKQKSILKKLPDDSYKIIVTSKSIELFGRDYYGAPKSAPCHPFRLAQTYNSNLKLSKYGESGTLFAVYSLLRQLGVRWFMPGELGEVIPQKANISLSTQNVTVSPDFSYRHIYFNNANYDPEGILWFKRLGLGSSDPIFFNHTLHHLQRKLQKTNPEYFAIIDGERDFKANRGYGVLKLSNPNVVNAVTKFGQEKLDKHRNLKIFPICLPDGFKRIDDSDSKKINWKLNENELLSNYVWGFMNKVAVNIYKTHPDRIVGNLAYQSWLAPPTTLKKLSPNLYIMFCVMGGQCNGRAAFFDEPYKKRLQSYINEWQEKTRKIYQWNYYLFWHKNDGLIGMPVFFTKIISNDLKFLKGKIAGEFIEGSKKYYGKRYSLASIGMQHLNIYVTARLYWNANLNLNQLINDYCQKFYGPATNEMKKFFKTAESLWMQHKKRKPLIELYTLKDLHKLSRILVKALQIAKKSTDSIYFRRILIIKNELDYFINTCQIRLKQTPLYQAHKVSEKAIIDGKKQEYSQQSSAIELKEMLSGRNSNIKTNINIAYDNKYLYIQAEAMEPRMSKLKLSSKTRDGFIWKDDTLEIFIMPINSKKYYQIAVTPAGNLWDGELNINKNSKISKPAAWNCNLKLKVKNYSDRWTVEMAIPLISLFDKKQKIKAFKANFMRSRFLRGICKCYSWSPTFRGSIHDYKRFGTITLND